MTRWLSPADCAAYIGKPKSSLQRLVVAGKLPRPSYHFGPKSPRWDREAIDSLLAGRQVSDGWAAATEQAIHETRAHRQTEAGGRHR